MRAGTEVSLFTPQGEILVAWNLVRPGTPFACTWAFRSQTSILSGGCLKLSYCRTSVLGHRGAPLSPSLLRSTRWRICGRQSMYKDRDDRTEWWQGDKWDRVWPCDWKVVTVRRRGEWGWELGSAGRVGDGREITWSGAGEVAGCGTMPRWMRSRGKKWGLFW